MRKNLAVSLTLVATLAVSLNALAATPAKYPVRPIKIIVPLSAGGPTDVLARIIAQPLSERLGQPVVIDNRPGAGGNIGADLVAKSPPDGYTLFMGTSGPMSINQALFEKLPYDPIKDFAPIMLVASAPFVVTVTPSFPASNYAQLVDYVKRNPGKVNYGAVSGSASHLATELFKSEAGANMTFIPYKGAAPATMDLMSGQIDVSFLSTPGAMPLLKSGKLRPIAVTSLKRLQQLPDTPTIAELGLPRFEASVWYGLVAPAGTPPEIVSLLNAEITKIMAERSVRENMRNNDFEVAGSTPEQFGAFIREELAKWSKVVKALGIKAD